MVFFSNFSSCTGCPGSSTAAESRRRIFMNEPLQFYYETPTPTRGSL